MNYTVITKSAWTTDQWQVNDTLTNKRQAERHAKVIKSSDAQSGTYNTAIKTHRKPLKELSQESTDFTTVKFSDGTAALR